MKLKDRIIKYLKNKITLSVFERKVIKSTWENHDLRLLSAENMLDSNKEIDDGLNANLVKDGNEYRQKLLNKYKEKYKDDEECKIIIHIPPKNISPGGYSCFSNLLYSFNFLGIKCEGLYWGENACQKLRDLSPKILITSDSSLYLKQFNWEEVNKYRAKNKLKIGLTASIDGGNKDNSLASRLRWAKENNIDFFYSFRSEEYIEKREDYLIYNLEGYKIFSIEFGANPLQYYPLYCNKKDIPYIFLASSNRDKIPRYSEWLTSIVSEYEGFIDGPGWSKIRNYAPIDLHKYLYSKSIVGINLHIEDSINWASELNERTYILAACGIPQLIDNPKLLLRRFSKNSIYQANNPKDYYELFKHILDSPEERIERAKKALYEVYDKHTTLHRAEKFYLELRKNSLI